MSPGRRRTLVRVPSRNPGPGAVQHSGTSVCARTLHGALRWAGATVANLFADVKAARDPRASHEKRTPDTNAEFNTLLSAATPQEKAKLPLTDSGLRNLEMTDVRRANLHIDEERPHVQVRAGAGAVGRSARHLPGGA